jgi:predicted MPP superfamily phosphohydrolase
MTLALFAAACLGHLVLVVASHNWWYGQPLPHGTGKPIHLIHGLLVVAFPVALALTWGPHLDGLFALSSAAAGQRLLALYVGLCLAAGLGGFPLITIARLLRREPVAFVRSRILDVAEQLGYRPEGEDKHRWLTRLPGNQALQLELVERTLCPPRLPPEWDGLTILHLSDLHLRGTPGRDYYRFVIDQCAAWNPDLVALTGDIADSWRHQRWIVPVLGRLRWGLSAFAILGNHDFWYDPPLIRRRLRRLGMNVLGNSWQVVQVRGLPLVVIGHEGPWAQPGPDLAECPEGPFRLLLSHTPDNINWARRAGVDLMLAGHVHGGQIRLPVIGSVLVPSRYGRRYDCGTFGEGPMLLHVSRGVSGEHPLRWGCRPEVTLLTLRCSA